MAASRVRAEDRPAALLRLLIAYSPIVVEIKGVLACTLVNSLRDSPRVCVQGVSMSGLPAHTIYWLCTVPHQIGFVKKALVKKFLFFLRQRGSILRCQPYFARLLPSRNCFWIASAHVLN